MRVNIYTGKTENFYRAAIPVDRKLEDLSRLNQAAEERLGGLNLIQEIDLMDSEILMKINQDGAVIWKIELNFNEG